MGWCVLKSRQTCVLGLVLGILAGCTPRILTPPPAPITLTGVVQLAPVKNERVKAYRVSPTGEVSSSAAAEGLTDANGNFSLSVPPGMYVIKTNGVGEHLDEATQQWQPACELTALVNTQETQEVPVTPMTALLKERALTLVRESGKTLTEAKALAEEEVAPKFNLNVEDLNQLPVSPWGISDMSALERSSKKRRIKMAEKLAVFSQFVNEFSFTGLSANEKLSKLMQALQADFKDDGKINGSVSGNLGLIAKKAALRWRAGMNAARTAMRSPSSALAFKDSNIQEAVESVTGAVTSEEDRFDTGSEIEGWHTDGIYYISGVQTSLDSDGEGFFLDEYYYLGRLAQIADGPLKTGQYYHQGASAHGVFNKVCFSQGGITTELNPNGDGTCSATSRYYEDGELKTGYVSNPTVLLLHMDGIEGGTSFTDSATPPKDATVNGSAAISTDQVKFGNGSGVFNSDSDSLTFSAHSQLNFLDQDWTVEFWYYPTGRHGIASSALSVWRDGPVTRAYWFGVLPDGSLFFKLNGDESSDFLSGPMDVVPLNAWSHIAFTRSGSTLRAFLNGNQVGGFQFATPIIDILDTPLAVGAKGSFDNSVKGYLDEVRITKGLARYTSNFTPASEPFTIEGAEAGYYIAGVLYPGLDETGTGTQTTNGKYYVNGNLANGLQATQTSGNITVDVGVDGSDEFVFSNNQISINHRNYQEPGSYSGYCPLAVNGIPWSEPIISNPFSLSTLGISMVEEASAIQLTPVLGRGAVTLTQTGDSSNGYTTKVFVDDDGPWGADCYKFTVSLRLNVDKCYSAGTERECTFSDYQCSENGYCAGNKKYYLSGLVQPGINSGGTGYDVGGSYYVNGSVANGLVSSDPHFDRTVLLLHMDGSNGSQTFTDSSSFNQSVTPNGNAQISTANSKFGGASASVPSFVTDSISINTNEDFTIELWFYHNSIGYYSGPGILSVSDGFSTWLWDSGPRRIFTHDGTWMGYITQGYYSWLHPTLETWHHLAVSRQDGTLRTFLDGQLLEYAAFSRSISGTFTFGLGDFNGYMDELRITKGLARYTSNFAVPTAFYGECYSNGVNTGTVIDGTGVCGGVYYLAGSATQLPLDGTGTHDGKQYFSGVLANGLIAGVCYAQGADIGTYFNGNGSCGGSYYIAGVLYPGLDQTGTGTHTSTGKYYVNGSLANGFVNGAPDDDNTVLLMHMDGEHGSTSFTDSSVSAFSPERVGSPFISTTQSRFGGASAYFHGTGENGSSERLQFGASDSLALGTADFTIEGWFFQTGTSQAIPMPLEIGGPHSNSDALGMWFYPNAWGNQGLTGWYSPPYNNSGPATSLNKWTHVAWVRKDGFMTIFVDGVGGSSASMPNSLGGSGLRIGGGAYQNYYNYEGYIDEVRITKGLARYTSNFTPATAAFGTSACYSNGVNTGTVIGGTGVCGWVYYLAGTATQLPLDGTGEHDGKQYFSGVLANGLIESVCYAQGVDTGTYSYGQGACAGLYYLSGVAQIGLDATGTGVNANDGLYYFNGSIANGYVDDGTVLLLHMDGANGSTSFVDSSVSNHSVTATGTAQVSNDNSVWGGGSAFFDGSYGTAVPVSFTNALDLQGVDFTVEFWMNPTDVDSGYMGIFAQEDFNYISLQLNENCASAPRQLSLWIDTDGVPGWDFGGACGRLAPSPFTANSWYHIALVRSGSTISLYKDGALEFSDTYSQTIFSNLTTPFYIGRSQLANRVFKGYIDEFRITKGRARYTSNFTPPWEPFGTSAGCYSNGVDTGGINSSGTGWCSGVYYVKGQATTLPQSGTGEHDGKQYFSGVLGNGLIAGVCYAAGVNTGTVSNGDGVCSGIYYSDGDAVGTWVSQGTYLGCSEPGGDASYNLLGEAWGSTAYGPNVHGGDCSQWCHSQFPGQVMCAQMYATWYYGGGHCACYSSSTTYEWPGFSDKEVWVFTPNSP